MCEVEAVINGRPLTAASDDPKDSGALTPNHLLLLREEMPLPPGIFRKEDNYSRKRWRQVQHLANIFWKRWSREYLSLQQQRQKWTHPRKNFAVGDIVLICGENTPRNQWPLGRIKEVYKDDKGLVRSVKVCSRNSEFHRPISKLCWLMET